MIEDWVKAKEVEFSRERVINILDQYWVEERRIIEEYGLYNPEFTQRQVHIPGLRRHFGVLKKAVAADPNLAKDIAENISPLVENLEAFIRVYQRQYRGFVDSNLSRINSKNPDESNEATDEYLGLMENHNRMNDSLKLSFGELIPEPTSLFPKGGVWLKSRRDSSEYKSFFLQSLKNVKEPI